MAVFYKGDKPHSYVYDNGGVLDMRSYMRADMVSLQAADEDPLLHYLQNIQLGPFDDVYAYDIRKELLLMEPVFHVAAGVYSVGAFYPDVSGAILGAFK